MRAFLLSLAFCVCWTAAAEFQVPPLTGPVVDQAGMLSADMRERLARFLFRLRDAGGTQIQIATVPDLGGVTIEEASIKTTDAWKLGGAKTDNGVLVLIAAKERRVRIEVGQGLEGNLPDVTASRIIREVIIPRFKQGDVDQGVADGVLAIVHYTNPEFLESQNYAAPAGEGRSRPALDKWIVLLMFLFFFIFPIIFGRRRRRSVLWGFPLGYGVGRLGRGGFGGGGGGWGSGGGGSWSGGGGGFSGGGASGGW